MAVDSVISAIKLGSSCEASCCGLSNQWHSWQQPRPLQDETLQGIRQKVPTHCKMQVMEDRLRLFLREICAWLQSRGMALFVIKPSEI